MPSYGEMYGVTTSAYTLALNLGKVSGSYYWKAM
jgi:hypothetical protein